MARDENGKWINPNTLSERERMDRRLEQAGLLNYQTKGLSSTDIAQRYENANINVQSNWSKQNYGMDVNEFRNPQVPVQSTLPQNGGGSSGVQSKTGLVGGGMTNQGGQSVGDNAQYIQLQNGLVIKAPKQAPPAPTQTAISAIRPQEETVTVQQALNGEINWEELPVANRKVLLSNPAFYEAGEITKYPAWMQQQILADPAFQWDKLPKWQKTYFELSSSPAGMGAVQGATLGLIGGPVGSVAGGAIGSALGWAAGKSGYDATKEFWEQENTVAGGFGLLNWLVEQAEKTVGMGFQVANAATDPNKSVTDVLNKESWNAGANFFEVITPAYLEAMNQGKGEIGWDDLGKTLPGLYAFAKIGDLILHPEKYKGQEYFLGSESPIQLDDSWIERIDNAREEIKNGRSYREVMMEMQTSVTAQLGDMVGQAAADPLNFLPNQTTRVGSAIAEASGNTVAAQALRQSEGLMEATRRYKTLVQTGEALKIDPNFRVDNMGLFSRMVAGVNQAGEVKMGSLLPTEAGLLQPVKDKTGWLRTMSEQTPHSRAQTGAGMFYENVSALLTRFDDPHEAVHYLKALSNNDMDTWAGLGTRFADSPEFYTVLPALKDFNTNQLDGVIQQWDLTQNNRDLLTRISDVLGEQPSKILDDLAQRGTKEQDYQRVVQRLETSSDPNAKALLADIQAGRLNADTLAQMVDVFTGEGALPWHPGQWKALMMDAMGSHFDEWVTKRLMLDKSPEAVSAFYQTTALMKQAQSILLLGGSPGYAVTNGLSNMVSRAVTGIYGYLSPKNINSFIERMGITPARFDEGVGIGGVVDTSPQPSPTRRGGVHTEAMTKAVRGKGALTTAKDRLAKISRGMPFSKLSSWFERIEGRQGFAIAMKDFWSKSWRRGTGFRTMSPELVNVIKQMGQDPNRIYAAIEAGMNQGEIEKALLGRQEGVQARSLIHDAAQKTGMSASQAAEMLEKIGIMDTLDTFLKGQTTREGVQAAFTRAERVAQDWIDMQTGEDLKAIAESVKQRVGLEGAAAALDVVQKAHGSYTDTWMDHYYRFGEVMNDLNFIDDQAQRSKAIDLNYEVSDGEFRRINARNAANYKGIFEAWGLSNNPDALKVLQAIGESDTAMTNAYRQMREIRRGFFEKYRNDWDNPAKWDEWNENNTRTSIIFERGFKLKEDAEIKMGQSLAEIYEGMYGPAAGEAARLWWDDVVKFGVEIRKREQDFRAGLEGLTREEIVTEKQQYYSETKIGVIAEMEKINSDGIARLEKVIRKGGGTGLTGQKSPNGPAPLSDPPVTDVTSPQMENTFGGSDVDEVNTLMAAAEQRKAEEARVNAERVASVWDVAEEYWSRGGNYSREIFQDQFALLEALRKPEYGGINDLQRLNDPRLTPEIVRQVMEARKVIKEATANEAAKAALTSPQPSPKGEGVKRKFDATQINNDTPLLRAIALHGGLDLKLVAEITGERRTRGMPGVFTKKGIGVDEMARMLADDGFDIDLNHPNDLGGIEQARELIRRARSGNPVYPKGHDFNADLMAAERAYIESFDFDSVPLDPTLWQAEFMGTITQGDLTKMWGMIGDYPVAFDPAALDEYVRLADETALRVEAQARDEIIAENFARAQEAITEAEVHAETVTTRNMLKEKFQEVFDLDDTQAQAYMELSDSVAGWYARMTGESADEFYSRYYEDVRKTVDQSSVDSGQLQVLSFEEFAAQNYGATRLPMAEEFHRQPRATATDKKRASQEILRRFSENDELNTQARVEYERLVAEGKVRAPSEIESLARKATGHPDNQSTQAARRLLEKRFTKDPSLTEKYPEISARFSKYNPDTFYQQQGPTAPKGAVTFDEDGIKATIHAFEAGDFSTLIHENGHVFRRVLKDVVERTGNADVLKDLQTIEQWAGVKDGNWGRVHEEKFARGFEQYITEGKAPTPALARAFESFKNWMLEIYKVIMGSAIDVKLSDDVRRVFDRMLGADGRKVQGMDGANFYVNDRVYYSSSQWNMTEILDDGRVRLVNDNGDVVETNANQLQRVEQFTLAIDEEARARNAAELKASIFNNQDFTNALEKIKEAKRRRNQEGRVDTLFQEADVPFGAYDEASKFFPESEARDQGWSQFVRPLLDAMQTGAQDQLSVGGLQMEGMAPEGQALMKRYMRDVQNDMATTKLATVRWGERQRDFAQLNYNNRYGVDRVFDSGYPYQFYYTRSLMTYGARAVDMPALFSNYARIRMQQERYERDIPERLRGKIKISAPWLPEWMGDGLYIDPIGNLFFPANVLRPFERAQRDKNYQEIEAERVLQEWAASGEYAENEIMQAVKARSGPVWERAFSEAQIRRESEIANPMDFFSTMFGPAWWLSTPLNLAGVKVPGISKGDPNKVSPLPIGNTARALDTVTQDTWAEPFGDIIGLIGKVEDWGREKLNLPTRGEYGEYYTKRQLANMVAEGLIGPDEAQLAMIEKSGALWDQAAQRVDMELAMRVPGMGAIYATLHDGPAAGAQAFLPSLFGAGVLPAGELEYRGLKQEWNEAWAKADAGDTTAVPAFFDAHPEYEAYLAKGKDDGDLLRSFLIGQIWDSYMALGDTNQRMARAEMGELFGQAFLNKETRSYETLDVETLTAWTRMLNGMVPKTAPPPTPPQMEGQFGEGSQQLRLYDESVTGITDQYFQQRTEKFPNWYETQQGYYALPKSERSSYLLANPALKEYWSWKDTWFKAYPEYQPIFNGQAFKRVDTSTWNPMLVDFVSQYAYTGGRLPSGARKALEQVWILEGRPMDDLDTWLDSEVVPAMMYGN